MTETTVDRRSLLRLAGLAAGGSALAAAGLAAPTAEAASVVRATGSVYVRSGASSSTRALGVLRKGQAVTVAGAVRNGKWQPVRFNGRLGYVSTRYLTRAAVATAAARPVVKQAARRVATPARGYASLPMVSRPSMPRGVTSRGAAVGREVRVAFPQVATMLGHRNDPGSDHGSGRAVDIMLPGNYRGAAQQALGQAIADHLRAHAGRLGITYVIWNQHIWSVQRASEGWRRMSNRGSDNANHKNHVHVSVR
ncbi:SH3 domain-containing protein [Luteococcus peritonei]|uniref:SH3 domain-containing protein n=1 Tax=Luteococcus peritonei TaxID=88874 RepID=A0ABW4RWX2_9ACTN